MNVMIVTYKFSLDQRVKLTELELKGRVIGLWTGRRGNEIEVRVCINGKYENIYFYEDELAAT